MDRNIILPLPVLLPVSSLSARRAWIEIVVLLLLCVLLLVALRKESVDRNKRFAISAHCFEGSLSARRAWIEISVMHCG